MFVFVKFAFLVVVAGYVAIAVLVWALQDRMIFLPQPQGIATVPLPDRWSSEDVIINVADGISLYAVLVKPPGGPAPLVIYFGGNAEDVTYLAQFADHYGGSALLLPQYRGFGRSQGRPSEAHLLADAVTFYDAMEKRADIQRSHISLHGRSLGSGVAVFLASQRTPRKVILTTPFDSLVHVGAAMYPFLPITLLLRHKFDSLARAPGMKIPALFLVAEMDQVIPSRHAKRLYDAWQGPKMWRGFPQRDHNNVSEAAGYWDTIAAFLRSAE